MNSNKAAFPVILTIDRNRRNLELLSQFLKNEGYETRQVSELSSFDSVIDHADINVVLALVDISGFDSDIWKHCEQLRSRGIPLLVLSPKHSSAIQQESFAHGARGVLVKPLVARELMTLVKEMIGSQA